MGYTKKQVFQNQTLQLYCEMGIKISIKLKRERDIICKEKSETSKHFKILTFKLREIHDLSFHQRILRNFMK